MIFDFFISIYFRILRWQLHQKRLHFFMELQEFTKTIKDSEFWYNSGKELEKVLINYERIMRLIVKVEKMEKYQKRGDIFDAKFYSEQLNRDILKIINHIENQLNKRLIELKNIYVINNKQNHKNIIQSNLDAQNIRVQLLIEEISSMLWKIQHLKNQIYQYSL